MVRLRLKGSLVSGYVCVSPRWHNRTSSPVLYDGQAANPWADLSAGRPASPAGARYRDIAACLIDQRTTAAAATRIILLRRMQSSNVLSRSIPIFRFEVKAGVRFLLICSKLYVSATFAKIIMFITPNRLSANRFLRG